MVSRLKKTGLLALDIYGKTLSPYMPGGCRFTPSCSHYSREAIEKYGVSKGLYLSARRLLRCHPLNPGGYDPVK